VETTRASETSPLEPPAAPEAPKVQPRQEPKREVTRPALVRDEILRAKKAHLMDLASAYDLETMGTKEDLRERLFAKLVDLEKEEERRQKEEHARPEESAPAAARPASVPEPAASPVEPPMSPIPVPEPAAVSPPTVTPPTYDPPRFEAPASPVEDSPTIVDLPKVEFSSPPMEMVAAPPPAAPEAPKVINPCPTCGRELSFIEKYDRYYCEHCKAYAPPVVKVVTVPAPPKVGKPCPTCGRELTYIPDYGRHYCYHCKKYAALEGKSEAAPSAEMEVLPPKPEPTPAPAPPPAVEIVAVRNPCPTCGRELSFIERYGRFYCYSCKKYAPPRPKNPCPNCGKELSYIAQYGRHYCPACGQYAPKELTAQILAARSAAVTATMAGGVAPPVAATAAATRTVTIPVHHHGSPGGAIGLAAAGIVVVLIYEFLWAMPVAFGGAPYVSFDPSNPQTTVAIGWMLQFIGFLMVGLAVIVGLIRVRTSK